MRWWPTAAASLLLACVGTPQGLAPDVLLLAHIKSHMREELSRIPNYTCLETVSRFRNDPASHPQSRGQLTALDTVRLEIVYTGRREWYGSPGQRSLSVDNPGAFISNGMIGSGAFALTLNNILEVANFAYRGEETLGGRTAVKFDFHVPSLLKTFRISLQGGDGMVGEEGSIWADPESLDIVRLESRANEIPPYLPLKEASTKVNYARVAIGGHHVLLAQQAESYILDTVGVESFNRLEFTHCRTYSTQSEIRFDPEPVQPLPSGSPPVPVPSSPHADADAVPAFLQIDVRLTTPISDKDAVGSLIEGKVSDDVLRKGKIVIPSGSVIHGRIRRLERYLGGGAFIVGLEFTEVEVSGGGLLPFYADLLRIDKSSRIQPTLSERVLVHDGAGVHPREETVTLRELPGVASFFVRGETLTIPSGFRMVWRTRGPIR